MKENGRKSFPLLCKSSGFMFLLLLGALTVQTMCAESSSKPVPVQLNPTNSRYWTFAEDTHNFVVGNLLTSYNSYRINPNSATSYTWYNISQIDADAVMNVEGDARFASYMNNAYSWMNNVWDSQSSIGGYFASANLDGSGSGGLKYVDDNSLAGVTYLDAYETTTGTQQAAYLASAESIANWLMNSGQWDSTCGGGFYWNSQTSPRSVKPTQSNALAMQLFLRLYKITGKSYYGQWATSIKNWLESNMYGPNGLYIWQVDPANNCNRYTANFTYDNAIVIEADLLWASVMNDSSYVAKAESIAHALNSVLWDASHKVYKFNTGDSRINPAWCVWASEALMRLYQADGNSIWLDYAQNNIDFMNTYLRDASNYGYYQWSNNDGSNRSTNQEEVDQAWMERTQALLALYR